ncbi:hypothetical protein BGP82_13090 [Pseudomonas putida]|uniref:Uncharacterized protein n=1 Tax=Pseudomonas putida TaxID=303 RepID=A0A1X1A4Y8_PSEPU|nr:hypothetical protein B7H19_19405 [Pseudomonas putida]POG02274.1 hypothetical protein BGP82_13090 [Pseudomonas putida]
MDKYRLMRKIRVFREALSSRGWRSDVLNKSTCAQLAPAGLMAMQGDRFCNSFALLQKPAVLVASSSQFVIKVYMSTFAEPPSFRLFWPSFPRPCDVSLVSTR